MSNPLRKILVTSALPYGNGSIHIGHLVEYIQTDIWVRFQRLRENDILYVCGDDAHGTPIMLKAQSLGLDPKTFIAQSNAEHQVDFAKFGVSFDHFFTTDSDINREISYDIFQRVKAAGLVTTQEIEQLFDPQAGIFLPDRFIRGTCPNCKTPDQYGDACEACGKTYDPTDLIDPKSAITGATPELRKSRHVFIQLEKARQQLLDLFDKNFVDPGIRNKLKEWFKDKLKNWDISRDAPFFGFPIPDEPGKYFYNWFDAPIGYLASLADKLGLDVAGVRAYWNDEDLERYHFIGKDITYFHALFWPAMLMNAGLAAPTRLAIHGFLTVNGEKMSKTRGTFINAAVYAKHCDPQWLRYYYATKLVPEPQDLDLSVEDFVARVNSELVGKLANLISRAAPLLIGLDGRTGVPVADAIPLLKEVRAAEPIIAKAYEDRDFAAATRLICSLADKVNKYVEDNAPWKLAKTAPEEARGVLTAALEAGRILTIYLKPVLPEFAKKVETCLALRPQLWRHIVDSMEPHQIAAFERLVDRIDPKQVQAMIDESKESLAPK
ncbi:MAG: methionine--tRNA ligase, partial [Phycisphaerae bacterium]